jgi:hypothetical protein
LARLRLLNAPSLYLSPGGREYTFTLSLRERVAKGRVRAFVASVLAALISSSI